MPGLLLLLAPHSADALPRAAYRDSYNTLRITTFGTSLPSPPSGGVFLSDPAAAQNLAGDTIVTARDSWGSLYVNVFSNSSQTWGQWSGPYGSVQGNPGIAVVPDGTVCIAARDNFYSYWLFRYRPGMGMLESVHLGGVFASDPSIAASPDGSVYLVGRDTYTSVWAYHFAPGFPSDWVFLGAIVHGKPVITAGSDRAAYVIVRENPNASSGNVWTGRLDDIHWSGWFLANAIAGDAELALAATAGASIFAAIADPWGSIYTCAFQTGENGPRCPSWTNTTGRLRTFSATAIDNDLYIEGLDFEQTPSLWWYRRSTGQWTSVGNTGAQGNTSAARQAPPAPIISANPTCPEQYHYWNDISTVNDITYAKAQTHMTPGRDDWTVGLTAAVLKNGAGLYGPASVQASSWDVAELIWELEDGPGTYSLNSIHSVFSPGAVCSAPNPLAATSSHTLGDLSPFITSMVPELFQAGSANVPVTIVGGNFGANPQIVIVEDPGFQVTITEATDTRIQFNLTVPSWVPVGCCYDFYVISRGATGSGFQQTPGRPVVSDRTYQSATVVPDGPVRLKVTANNIPLAPGDSAYISAIPQMPRIAARLEDANGQPISGSVQWNLTVTWFQKKRGNPYKEEFSATLAAGQEWVPVQSDSTDFFGGEAKINWTYNGYSPSTPFAFRIAGTNPSQSDALAELVSKEQTSGIWFLRNIAIHETTLQQFCPTGWKECKPRDPFWTNSAGYGMMQLDPPPTLASVWNWRTNIAEAVTVLQNKAGPPVDTLDNEDKRAFPFYLRQVRQWRQWNQIPNTPQVPAPLDYPADSNYTIGGRRVRDFCQFTLSEVPLDGPVIRWYGDATLMKQYAGTLGPTGNANFLVWDNETNPLFPEWKFHPATTKDADIASEFCTCRTVATCVR